MRDLGGRSRNRHGEEYDLVVENGGVLLISNYRKDELVGVGVNFGSARRRSVRVTFEGKSAILPTSESDLFKQLGQPRAFQKSIPPS
jgi:hypothetical protein